MRCKNCDETGLRRLFDDPNNPPLDENPCLCADCSSNFIEDLISEATDRINELNEMKREVNRAGR
jgi:hypothetical protein